MGVNLARVCNFLAFAWGIGQNAGHILLSDVHTAFIGSDDRMKASNAQLGDPFIYYIGFHQLKYSIINENFEHIAK